MHRCVLLSSLEAPGSRYAHLYKCASPCELICTHTSPHADRIHSDSRDDREARSSALHRFSAIRLSCVGGWKFFDQTHKTKSTSHLLDYETMLTRPNSLSPHIVTYCWCSVVGARGRRCGRRARCLRLSANHYQTGSHPDTVQKSLEERAVFRSTHIKIEIRVIRF